MVDFYKSPAFSYPVPDPYWDYCVIWHELHEIKALLDKLTDDMVFQQEASEDFDRHLDRVTERIRERLKEIVDTNASAYINAEDLEAIQ
ncbi:MAG: hypothetical protein ACRC11_18150 [Xenococcaceae cyanobacterium]